MLNLSDLKIGEQALIKGFSNTCPIYRQRLLTIGLTKGAAFTLVRRAPLGCPIAIKIRDSIITLRQNEASCLLLEKACASNKGVATCLT